MAQTARPSDKGAVSMAESGELHQREKHRGDSAGVNRRRHITEEQKQRIRELYEVTKNGHKVAQITGLGSTTVYNHLRLKKYKKPRWTDEEDQIVIDGYFEKKSLKEIAGILGKSEGAIAIHMHRHRKKIREDPKKKRALSAITLAFKAVRKADIFREVET